MAAAARRTEKTGRPVITRCAANANTSPSTIHITSCTPTEASRKRHSVVAGNFFESVPDGGDAYLLKWIIHDWEDEESITILRNVRSRGGTLLLIERILGPPNETPEAKLSDLNMLVGPGGQERTIEEFESLLEAVGYELVGTTPTDSGMFVIEGAPTR